MKKIYKKTVIAILAISVLFISKAFSQYTLQTAVNVNISEESIPNGGAVLYPLPAVGTTVPSGPYYGDMNINTNPMWFYIPTCVDFSNALTHFGFYNLWPQPTFIAANVTWWGPFDNISSINLNDLDASKFIYCDTLIQDFGFNDGIYPVDIIPGCATKKVYIVLLTVADSLLPDDVWLTVTSPDFSSNDPIFFTCHLCNGQATYMELQEKFCMVTVDTSTNHVQLVWNKDASDYGMAGFRIKKEGFVIGQYDSVDFVPFSSFSTWTDVNSNAIVKKYKYKMDFLDSCGNVYDNYIYLQQSQMYLQASPSTNNTVNLIIDASASWPFNSATSVFYIWRSDNGNPYAIIDSLPASFAVQYYTDVNAPAGMIKYMIECQLTTPCTPSILPGYGSIISNISGGTVTGLAEIPLSNYISIYPNPFSQSTMVDLSYLHGAAVTLSVRSLKGELLFETRLVNETKYVFEKGSLSKGIYLLEIAGEQTARKKLVID